MHGRNMKDRVHAILGVYGIYDPAVVTNPSRLQTIARHLKDKMDDAEAARRAALDAERLRQEARQRQNVRQEGALGAIPQVYGIDAPCVAGANDEMQRHFQQAADLLAQNRGLRTTTSAPLFPRSCLVLATKTVTRGWSSRPFLFVVSLKEPQQLPSKGMSSMFRSSQLSMSLRPCRCLLLPPMQELTSLLSQDR